MVRLKRKKEEERLKQINEFQFHNGSIKTPKEIVDRNKFF